MAEHRFADPHHRVVRRRRRNGSPRSRRRGRFRCSVLPEIGARSSRCRTFLGSAGARVLTVVATDAGDGDIVRPRGAGASHRSSAAGPRRGLGDGRRGARHPGVRCGRGDAPRTGERPPQGGCDRDVGGRHPLAIGPATVRGSCCAATEEHSWRSSRLERAGRRCARRGRRHVVDRGPGSVQRYSGRASTPSATSSVRPSCTPWPHGMAGSDVKPRQTATATRSLDDPRSTYRPPWPSPCDAIRRAPQGRWVHRLDRRWDSHRARDDPPRHAVSAWTSHGQPERKMEQMTRSERDICSIFPMGGPMSVVSVGEQLGLVRTRIEGRAAMDACRQIRRRDEGIGSRR